MEAEFKKEQKLFTGKKIMILLFEIKVLK